MSSSANPDPSALAWLFSFVRPHRRALALVVSLSLAASALGLAQPYLTKLIIDEGILAARPRLLVILCGAVVAAALLGLVIGGLNRWLYVRTSGRILFELRETVYRHLLRLSPTFFSNRSPGDLIARLDGDVAEIQRFSTDTLLVVLNGTLVLLGSVAVMFVLSWQLALLAFIVLPVQIVFLHGMRTRVARNTQRVREQTGRITGFFVETLAAMKFIQSTASEGREAGRLVALNDDYLRDILRLQMVNYSTGGVTNLLLNVATAVVFITGGLLIIGQSFTLGTLIAFVAYMTRSTGPIRTFLGLFTAYQRAGVSLGRVRELTLHTPAVTASPGLPTIAAGARGQLTFERLSFTHPGSHEPVLRDVTEGFEAGTKIVIGGPSGAGKSTLIDLLQRFYDPQAGRILLDGRDLREIDLASLRRNVTVVPQQPVLFAGSVIDNLRYGHFDAPESGLIDAARRSGVDDFVKELPLGYQSKVGESGAKLSGGQRQRIAIARALVGVPLVLILDEATSSVDSQTTRAIESQIDELFAERTRIVITHNPGQVQLPDRVYEIREGRLVRLK